MMLLLFISMSFAANGAADRCARAVLPAAAAEELNALYTSTEDTSADEAERMRRMADFEAMILSLEAQGITIGGYDPIAEIRSPPTEAASIASAEYPAHIQRIFALKQDIIEYSEEFGSTNIWQLLHSMLDTLDSPWTDEDKISAALKVLRHQRLGRVLKRRGHALSDQFINLSTAVTYKPDGKGSYTALVLTWLAAATSRSAGYKQVFSALLGLSAAENCIDEREYNHILNKLVHWHNDYSDQLIERLQLPLWGSLLTNILIAEPTYGLNSIILRQRKSFTNLLRHYTPGLPSAAKVDINSRAWATDSAYQAPHSAMITLLENFAAGSKRISFSNDMDQSEKDSSLDNQIEMMKIVLAAPGVQAPFGLRDLLEKGYIPEILQRPGIGAVLERLRELESQGLVVQ